MNCQDIEALLDNRDTGRLDAATLKEVSAHAGGCAGCARDWELHGRFAALPDAAASANFAARCRDVVASSVAVRRASPAGRRYMLAGAIVAACAAAAGLATYAWRSASPQGSRAAADLTVQVEDFAPVAAAQAAPEPSSVFAGARSSSATSASPPAVVSFSVQVMPLQNDARNAAGRASLDSFYGALLEQLRTVEGLRLVMANAADAQAGADADVQLQILGAGPDPGNNLAVTVRARRRGPPGFVLPIKGGFNADCVDSAGPSPSCFDAGAFAKSLVELLRTAMFPATPDQYQLLLTRLQDAALAPQERLSALQGLGSTRFLRSRDPAVVRAAIELAETTAVPAIREGLWRQMRGVGDSQLLRPLISSAHLDALQGVRTEAVRTLGADFAMQPEARAALEVIARQDPSPLVRAMAQRGLKGEEAWNSYLAESLEDASRRDEERLEALLYHVSWPPQGYYQDSLKVLQPLIDHDAIPALAQILPRVAKSGADQDAIARLISHLGAVHHPAVTDFLIERVDASADAGERRIVIGKLVQRNRDVRVRAALAKVASGDPDPELREMAEDGLREPSAANGP